MHVRGSPSTQEPSFQARIMRKHARSPSPPQTVRKERKLHRRQITRVRWSPPDPEISAQAADTNTLLQKQRYGLKSGHPSEIYQVISSATVLLRGG